MGVSFTPENSTSQVKEVQYRVEGNTKTAPATYGVLVTASPAYTAAGLNATIESQSPPRFEDTYKPGNVSRQQRTKVKESHRATLRTKIVNDTLLKWGMKIPGGTGTAEESMAFVKSYYVNQQETWEHFLGCLPEETSISVSNEGLLILEIQMRCSDIYETQSANGGLTTPTWATPLAGVPWKADDGGASRLQVNSINYYEMGFSITVSNRYSVTNPSENQKDLHARVVQQTGRMTLDIVRSSLAVSTDALAGTARTIVLVIKAATSTITISGATADERRGARHDPNDTNTITEPMSYTFNSLAIA